MSRLRQAHCVNFIGWRWSYAAACSQWLLSQRRRPFCRTGVFMRLWTDGGGRKERNQLKQANGKVDRKRKKKTLSHLKEIKFRETKKS